MSKYPTLANPPLAEAVLDIRLQLPEGVSLNTLASIHPIIIDKFPEKEERLTIEAGIKLSKEGPPETESKKK